MGLTADMIREAIPHAGEVVWRDGQTTEKIFLEKMAEQIEGERKLSRKQEALTRKIMRRVVKRSEKIWNPQEDASNFSVFGADTRWGVYENGDLLMVFDERPKAAAWVHDIEGDFSIRAISIADATEATASEFVEDDDGWFD